MSTSLYFVHAYDLRLLNNLSLYCKNASRCDSWSHDSIFSEDEHTAKAFSYAVPAVTIEYKDGVQKNILFELFLVCPTKTNSSVQPNQTRLSNENKLVRPTKSNSSVQRKQTRLSNENKLVCPMKTNSQPSTKMQINVFYFIRKFCSPSTETFLTFS